MEVLISFPNSLDEIFTLTDDNIESMPSLNHFLKENCAVQGDFQIMIFHNRFQKHVLLKDVASVQDGCQLKVSRSVIS